MLPPPRRKPRLQLYHARIALGHCGRFKPFLLHRRSALCQRFDRLHQFPAVEQLAHRRALTTGKNQTIDAVEIYGKSHFACLNAKFLEHANVFGEIALDCKDADGRRDVALRHGATSRAWRGVRPRGSCASQSPSLLRQGPPILPRGWRRSSNVWLPARWRQRSWLGSSP